MLHSKLYLNSNRFQEKLSHPQPTQILKLIVSTCVWLVSQINSTDLLILCYCLGPVLAVPGFGPSLPFLGVDFLTVLPWLWLSLLLCAANMDHLDGSLSWGRGGPDYFPFWWPPVGIQGPGSWRCFHLWVPKEPGASGSCPPESYSCSLCPSVPFPLWRQIPPISWCPLQPP